MDTRWHNQLDWNTLPKDVKTLFADINDSEFDKDVDWNDDENHYHIKNSSIIIYLYIINFIRISNEGIKRKLCRIM